MFLRHSGHGDALQGHFLYVARFVNTHVLTYAFGSWSPPLGITYRLDILNAPFLVLVTFLGLVVATYAVPSLADIPAFPDSKTGHHKEYNLFFVLLLLYIAGFSGVVVTGDIFNAFVFLEIASLASYALISSNGSRNPRAFEAAFVYLIINSVGAGLFLLGIGFLFSATGTLNMHALSQVVAHRSQVPVDVGFALIISGLFLKMAVFFMHRFLPQLYATSSAPVAALIASVTPKVIFYLLVRCTISIVGIRFFYRYPLIQTYAIVLALGGIVITPIFACFAYNLRRLLAYSSIAQTSYLLLGLVLASPLAMSAAFIQVFAHALVKSGLFMGCGLYEQRFESANLQALHGKVRQAPQLGYIMNALMFSLMGVPFTMGFLAKWMFLEATWHTWHNIPFVAVILSSFLSLFYVMRLLFVLYFPQRQSSPQRLATPSTTASEENPAENPTKPHTPPLDGMPAQGRIRSLLTTRYRRALGLVPLSPSSLQKDESHVSNGQHEEKHNMISVAHGNKKQSPIYRYGKFKGNIITRLAPHACAFMC